MSSIPPLSCLFCKHLNSPDAIFCNACGKRLRLQQCHQCGAINHQAAQYCQKCGAKFTLPAAGILDKQLASPALNDAVAAAPDARRPTHDLAQSSAGQRPVNEAISSEMGTTAPSLQRRMLLITAALLLVLAIDVVFVYFYYGQPVQLAQKQGDRQALPDESGTPKREGSTPPTVATQIDSALKPAADTASKPAPGTDSAENAPSLAAPGAAATLAVRPLPATDTEVKTRQEPPIFKDCPEAVATLGFCNRDTKQEKQ